MALVLAANFEFAGFRKQKYTAYGHFHADGPYGKVPTNEEPISTLRFTSRLPCHKIMVHIYMRSSVAQLKSLTGTAAGTVLHSHCLCIQFDPL